MRLGLGLGEGYDMCVGRLKCGFGVFGDGDRRRPRRWRLHELLAVRDGLDAESVGERAVAQLEDEAHDRVLEEP